MSDELERIVEMSPAFDKRHPDPSKDYGIHGVELRMVLKGERGATQFLLYTNWQLPHVTKELDAKPIQREHPHLMCHPMPADLGYHALEPRYEGQLKADCPYTSSGFCYYDGSGLNAERVYQILLRGGSDGVWRELEDYYRQLFSDEPALSTTANV